MHNAILETTNSPHSAPASERPSRPFLLAAVLCQQLLGGLTFPIAKFGLAYIEPFTFALFRYLLSSLILLGIISVRMYSNRIDRRDYKKIIMLGILIIPLNQTAYLYGQHLTGAGHGSLIFATLPIWIFIGGLTVLRERFILKRALGVMIGLVGVATIMISGALELGYQYLVGDIIILMAVIAWAGYTILGAPLAKRYGALRITAYSLAVGTVFYLPFGTYKTIQFSFKKVPLTAWLTVIYAAVGVSVIAYVLWYWILKHVAATRIAVFQNLTPVIATIVAHFFLKEPIGWTLAVGGIIVLTGVFVTELPLLFNHTQKHRKRTSYQAIP